MSATAPTAHAVSFISAAPAEKPFLETVFIVPSDEGFFYGEFGLAQERRLAYATNCRRDWIGCWRGLVAGGYHNPWARNQSAP